MKIVVLGTRGFPHVQGGVERHCEELYPRLVKLGCDVTVITRTPYIPKEKRISQWRGVKFVHLWCPKRKSLEAIIHSFLGVLKARTLSPHVLHIHSVGPNLLTPLAKLLGLRVIMTHHGPDYEREKWGKLAKTVLRLGEKSGVTFADSIISISDGIRKQVKDKYGKEAALVPNGVSAPALIPPGKILEQFSLKPERYVFTACRFVPEKGLHDLIEAYKNIKEPPFKLVIAGDADHETDYSRNLKKEASKAKGVVLTGFIAGAKLGELFSNAGLFVLPSYYEGLPIALLEALSYGLPVLVSDIPQHREIPLCINRYFEKSNINHLTKKLMECFEKSIEEKEKKNYLSLLEEHYNWDKIALKTLNIYEKISNHAA